MRTVAFCEIDPKRRSVLARHWPGVPCHDDIRTFRPRFDVDVVCGGFPCQPFSSASRGRKRGTEDDRFLWPEMLRIVSDLRPSWVVCENANELNGLGLDQIASGLENVDYEVLPLGIPACAKGADHIRRRCWLVGYTDRKGQSIGTIDAEMAGMQRLGDDTGGLGASDGVPGRMDRFRMIGDSVHVDVIEELGRAVVSAHHALA